MPLPLAPIAGVAIRYGAIAVATYAITRKRNAARRSQPVEDEMDQVDEGISMRRDKGQANANGRIKRTVRLGPNGPGVEIDITALSRIKIKKV